MHLLNGAYAAIKQADPDALVISAGLSPTTAPPPTAVPDVEYLKQMYENGLKDASDLVGVHAAGFKSPPEADPGEVAKDPALTNRDPSPVEARRVYAFRHVEDLRKVMVDNADAAKRVAVLEFGWTTDNRPNSPYAWHAVTEQQKAQYLAGAYRYAAQNWRPWVAVMVNIYIAAPYWTQKDEQWYWSITDERGVPRPAYEALRSLEKVK